jgi:PST family polysaccharide transporter
MSGAPDDFLTPVDAGGLANTEIVAPPINPPEGGLDSATLKKRVIGGAGATLASQVVKFGLKFGSAIVLGRLLGPAQFGLVAMVAPILGFVSTLNDLGFAQAVVQRRDITQEQISGLFWVNVLLSLVLAGALAACAPLIGAIYHEPRTIGITMVLAALIVVGTLGLVPNAILNRQLRFVPLAIIDALSMAVSFASSVAFALLGFQYWSLVLGQVMGSCTGLLATYFVAEWWPNRPKRNANIAPLVRFGANLTAVNLATYFNMTADNMIIGVFAGKVSLGLYDRSYTLVVQPITQLTNPIGRIAVPLLSRLSDTQERFRTTYIGMVNIAAILTVPLMIFCSIMPDRVILFLLGAKWLGAAPIFQWISVGGIFSAIFGSTAWVFTSHGRTHLQMILTIIATTVGILSFLLGTRWGVAGVAMCGAIGFGAIQLPLMLWGIVHIGAVKLSDVLRTVASLSLAGLAAGAIELLGRQYVFWGDLFVKAGLAYAIFGVLALILPGGKELRLTLWQIVSKSWLGPRVQNLGQIGRRFSKFSR